MKHIVHSIIGFFIKKRLFRTLFLGGLFLLMAGNEMAGQDFTLVVIPDPQYYASSYTEIYNLQIQWITNNKIASNIVFATAVGDLVNDSLSSSEYTIADAAFDILDIGGVSYSVSPGNHDGGTRWVSNFGASRFLGKSWYDGSLDDYNSFSHFSASGMEFIIINLQYSPGTKQLHWADSLLKANSSRRAIVVQHNILNTDNSWIDQDSTSYMALKDNPNLFLMLCGHMSSSDDGAAYLSKLGDDGHTIHIMLADYQHFPPNGGNGYLRILRFSPATNKIYATTYSPYIVASITTSPDQMEMVYNMEDGPPTPYNVTGSGSYCQGTGGLLVGLDNSELGVTYTLIKNVVDTVTTVDGTGEAITFGNQFFGTYTVIGTNGNGPTVMNGSAVIAENSLPVVTFITQPGLRACIGVDVTYTTEASMTSYLWSFLGILNVDYSITSGGTGSSNTVTLKYLSAGSKTVTINYTNSDGCTAASATSSTDTMVNLLPTTSAIYHQ